MYKKIYKKIKEYKNIVIARHIGGDPDAISSQIGLREIIKYNFPDKCVYTVGTSSVKFNYIGFLDKKVDYDKLEDVLLILLDTPDRKRADMGEITNYKDSVKIDHHPFIEKICDIELIDETKSSTAEMIVDLVNNTKLKINSDIARILFIGIAGDTERFMFNNAKPETFRVVADLIENYDLDINKIYESMYTKHLNEVKFQGYMAQNMIYKDCGLMYVKITNDIISQYEIDSASSGNMINNFNFIEGVLVWLSMAEDIKNECVRVSIRSKGPIINKIAEKYNGGGHKYASGARVKSFDEAFALLEELEDLCIDYNEKSGDSK
ncbi:MAG TPA: bifunctional oligoribonuclease/PAP phosphatase NrnA [Bacilli bacterium]|nr:bifunctional oligoribonuclease/PAP phosphatase NrnA [Bacilli bacterium]